MRNTLFIYVVLLAFNAFCQDCHLPSGSGVSADAARYGINVSYDQSNATLASAVDNATAQWNNCSGNVPNLNKNSPASNRPTVLVTLVQGSPPDRYFAVFDTTYKCITLFTNDFEGDSLLTSLPEILAHELGHALGLADVTSSNCLMGPGIPSNGVEPTDCSGVQGVWQSVYQSPPTCPP